MGQIRSYRSKESNWSYGHKGQISHIDSDDAGLSDMTALANLTLLTYMTNFTYFPLIFSIVPRKAGFLNNV